MTIFKCQLNGTYITTRPFTTSFYIESTADKITVNSALNTAWSTLWTTATNGMEHYCHTDVALTGTTTYVLNSSLMATDKRFDALALAGTDTSQSLPFQNAPWIHFTGPNITKSDRGGMFLPTVAQDVISGGLLTTAYVDSMKIVFDAFWISMRALAGYSNARFNRRTNKQGDPPFTAHTITNYTFDNKMRTRRGRVRELAASHVVTGTV
jgi:hypothetical protein